MNDKFVLEAVDALRRVNKVPNLHVRLPADELPNGDLLIECDTCDNLFFNSQNHWVKFYVRIYQSDLSAQPQDIDKESGITNVKQSDKIPARIAFRIHLEYKKVIGR